MRNYRIKHLEEYYQVYRKSFGSLKLLGKIGRRAFNVAQKMGQCAELGFQ